MFKKRFFIVALILSACTNNEDTRHFEYPLKFETSNGTETSNYNEIIDFYSAAADFSSFISLNEFGVTDSGEALHLLQIKPEEQVENPLKFLIINGIHPGEPDGIDASMLMIKSIIDNTIQLPKEIELYILPVYNIGGAKNRNNSSRANQNGPEEYGFRGNALNYDLNRDFIKSDTQNSKAFYQIYHHVNPDVFVDTHVSNGADYQYTLTHLFTQSQQLGGDLGTYVHKDFIPKLEADLLTKSLPITPYVNVFNRTPQDGFSQFLDSPRYSTGYTSLWNSLGLMIETHMLKAYKQRVDATLEMLKSLIYSSAKESSKIKQLRAQNFEKHLKAKNYDFNFQVDTTQYKTFSFLGYNATQEKSKVTEGKRLKYNTDQPLTYPVKYYNYFSPTNTVEIPKAYIIPKSYQKILELFQFNQVKMTKFQKDTILNAEVYSISNYKTGNAPYEGHYLHYQTEVESTIEKVEVKQGDVLIETNQKAIRYIIETLEPEAVDSFFNWNFFDVILQRKEGFSPYVFEDIAEEILLKNSDLRIKFDTLKSTNEEFANNAYAQLDWIYKHSKYYEKAHHRYPIYRIPK
jgi:hypothetical protein